MTKRPNSARLIQLTICLLLAHAAVESCVADVALPTIFSDHMVLQQGQAVPVWGWAEPGEEITVQFAGQELHAVADSSGKWRVTLAPLGVSNEPQTLKVVGHSTVQVQDVLVGEVWLCSGQSNMEWPVQASWNGDLAIDAANYPMVRHTTVRNMGLQVLNEDYLGEWQVCTPKSIREFSAVGFLFGRNLAEALNVPIGLIDNAWGGSACEAWVRRDLLAADGEYETLLSNWANSEAEPDLKQAYTAYEVQFKQWMADQIAAKKNKQPIPPMPTADYGNRLLTQGRPENLYNSRLGPLMPYAIRGVIWYQGESNAPRAYQYRSLFPLMIKNWRDDWGQGDFPFYWVQLADFKPERDNPSESDWAELREAQTMTLAALPHTGQAVTIDLGEAADIHPRNKQEVANRLSRLALANEYGKPIVCRSPQYKEITYSDGKAIITFDDVGGGLRTVDDSLVHGFAIAGSDKKWMWGKAKIVDKQTIEVSHEALEQPVAVRYGWADNPVCNVYSGEGLPLTPFRTDDWPGVTETSK